MSAVTPHEVERKGVALALDLGTTTLAGRLLTADGTVLAETRLANPQRPLGADILTRLQRAEAGEGAELRRLLIEGIGALVAELLSGAGGKAEHIAAAAAAGNPGICHLLLGLPVASLLHPPHRTPLTQLVTLPMGVLLDHGAFDAGDSDTGILVNSLNWEPATNPPIDQYTNIPLLNSSSLTTHITLFPAVSGFVGGDLVAVLYGACGTVDPYPGILANSLNRESATDRPIHQYPHESALPVTLVLDLGTNAELALWNGTRWLATSAAAGPAFEAGNITCGMPLAPGAVTDVRICGDRLELTVFGGGRPEGLCGSGLLALVAAARQGGLIDATGRIIAPDEVGTNLARYLVADGEGWGICFHRDARGELRLTQEDVRQLQLAKGAVRAGIDVLLDRAGLTPADVAEVLLTGAFGAALPTAAVKGIALLPAAMLDKLFCVPNGVLDGLAAFVTDPRGPERLKALHAALKPLPLSGTPAFERRFLAAMDFG